MASDRSQVFKLSVAVALAITGLVFAVQATLAVGRARAKFRSEMAQRFDVEERLTKAEKERAVLSARLEDLKIEADQLGERVVVAGTALLRERADKEALAAELERLRAVSVTSVPADQT